MSIKIFHCSASTVSNPYKWSETRPAWRLKTITKIGLKSFIQYSDTWIIIGNKQEGIFLFFFGFSVEFTLKACKMRTEKIKM